jgi:nitroimidazol reductase NimA-like FMN-containing flavoprotein (pyridoxamine 5'-phosphate oxidase superfamily)
MYLRSRALPGLVALSETMNHMSCRSTVIWEGDYLYSHSLPGLKISALRENPHVCVQVDQIETELRWRSALVFGKI